jgi:hypothetical protein
MALQALQVECCFFSNDDDDVQLPFSWQHCNCPYTAALVLQLHSTQCLQERTREIRQRKKEMLYQAAAAAAAAAENGSQEA